MASVSNDELRRLYVDEGKSIPDVAAVIGLPYSVARKQLIDAGITLRTRADGIRKARAKLGKHMIGKKRVFTEQWKSNMQKAHQERADKHAKGTSLKPNGYVEITRGPDKGRGQHRVIMEKKLGRKLGRDEVVHHDDECRSNNSDENLELMTRSAHTKHHRKKQKGSTNGIR